MHAGDRPVVRRCLATLVGTLLVAVLVGLLGRPAGAQGGESIGGTITGPDGPVEGVVLVVEQDGTVVGDATTGADGRWSVPVPGPGVYDVALQVDTLPDGVTLANPDRATLEGVDVRAGQAKVVLFPTDTGGGGGTSRFEEFINIFAGGVRYGLVIALSAIGLSLIFGTTGLTNFAHGELVTFGALVTWYLNSPSDGLGITIVLAAVLGTALSGGFGWVLDAGLWGPLRRRRTGNVALIVVSIGLAMFLRYSYLLIFGGNPRPYAQYATQPPWDIGGLLLRPKEVVIMLVCIGMLLAVGLGLTRTRIGTAVRAVADNRDLAESSGIDVRRVIRVVWVAGAGLAGLSGVMLGLTEGVQWDMGFRILLVVFAAVVVGGLGSAFGAVAGGLLIGIVSEVSAFWFPTDFKVVFALAALVIVLLVRPQGFFGVRERVG